ncbi:MAG: hypothetical protein ACYTFW_21150, partial [Planctomycetota bacterium]
MKNIQFPTAVPAKNIISKLASPITAAMIFIFFYELFDLLVVSWLYGFPLLITIASSIKFRLLRVKEDFDIIFEL